MAKELRPHATEWEDARWFPDEVFGKLASAGFLGLKYPEEYGGEGGDYVHDAVFAEELGGCGSGGVAAGIGAHVSIATPAGVEVRDRGAEAALPDPRRARRADRRPGHHRAGRGVRRGRHPHPGEEGRRRLPGQRLEDLHHQRRARRLRGHRREDHGRRRPLRSVVPADRARHGGLQRLQEAREDGLARLRHRRARVPGRIRARREPAGRGEQGLLPDHGQLPVGAAAHGHRRGGIDAPGDRADGRVRAGAPGVRPPDRPLPGDPPQGRGDGGQAGDRRAP